MGRLDYRKFFNFVTVKVAQQKEKMFKPPTVTATGPAVMNSVCLLWVGREASAGFGSFPFSFSFPFPLQLREPRMSASEQCSENCIKCFFLVLPFV